MNYFRLTFSYSRAKIYLSALNYPVLMNLDTCCISIFRFPVLVVCFVYFVDSFYFLHIFLFCRRRNTKRVRKTSMAVNKKLMVNPFSLTRNVKMQFILLPSYEKADCESHTLNDGLSQFSQELTVLQVHKCYCFVFVRSSSLRLKCICVYYFSKQNTNIVMIRNEHTAYPNKNYHAFRFRKDSKAPHLFDIRHTLILLTYSHLKNIPEFPPFQLQTQFFVVLLQLLLFI